MTLLVREAQTKDAQDIVNILNPIIEEGLFTILDITFSVEDEEQFIQDFPERGVFHVALNEEGSSVIGFQNVEPFAAYTHAFDHVGIIGTFVDASCRRQGVASILFKATFNLARSKGYEKLFAYVREDNPNALATYLRQGFEVVGTAKKHAKVRGKYIDEILIEKFL
ncbi:MULTISPECIES: GNAT family N-acetyltransferase [unclassified Marinomonas]|uniref:GNAT family N-acetyltransferase n=1 Tax=unclassified Marinomonas TaxID=196814 RepID=UPI000C1E144A|nr:MULTISPECIES: GNAT family N-acetyltransferase [unclassified Marinomonas]PJE54663.1 histone acetyltransferase [Marinomonas sp. BSi20584]